MFNVWRERFNAAYDDNAFRSALHAIEAVCGGAIPFRLAESPLFLTPDLLRRMDHAAREMLDQIAAVPGYGDAVARRLPAGALIPGGASPLFLMVDFALAEAADGGIEPALTELQGFPSLFAFQYELSRLYRDAYRLPEALPFLAPGLDEDGFLRLFRRALLGGQPVENVVLLEVRPWQQGTWPDFRLTERLLPGLAVVDPVELKKRGRRLFRSVNGREVEVTRAYWRIVWEDWQAARERIAFDLRDDLDLEWAGHPNGFFLYGKVSLPYLRHPFAPQARFLDDWPAWPADLENWVLKPLFSLSGRGIELDLEAGRLDAIAPAERGGYLLQRKFRYAEAIRALDGTVRSEVRLMYIWLDTPILTMVMPRMSRGRLMGCSFNRTDPWTGHGVAFLPEGVPSG